MSRGSAKEPPSPQKPSKERTANDKNSATDVRETKAAMRAEIKARVAAVSRFARERRSTAAAMLAIRSPALARARIVLSFRALPDEIDADPLTRLLSERGVRVVFPRVDAHGALELLAPPAGQPLEARFFATDRYGIASPDPQAAGVERFAPRDLDAVVVPGRAFDARGARLGRGKGFYDSLIARLRPDARAATVGLCHREQLVAQVPEDAHDRRVAWVATDRALLRARA